MQTHFLPGCIVHRPRFETPMVSMSFQWHTSLKFLVPATRSPTIMRYSTHSDMPHQLRSPLLAHHQVPPPTDSFSISRFCSGVCARRTPPSLFASPRFSPSIESFLAALVFSPSLDFHSLGLIYDKNTTQFIYSSDWSFMLLLGLVLLPGHQQPQSQPAGQLL